MDLKFFINKWIELFNSADAEAIARLYHVDAINHQIPNEKIEGQAAIKEMFENEFATAKMVCIPKYIFVDGEHVILEWEDPLGLRGCGFFHVVDGKIKEQRGYWDKLSFLKQHHLPIE